MTKRASRLMAAVALVIGVGTGGRGGGARADAYRIQWAAFDNAAHSARVIGDPVMVRERRAIAPADVMAAGLASGFIDARIAAIHPGYPAWATPVTVHCRREKTRWALVGLARRPE